MEFVEIFWRALCSFSEAAEEILEQFQRGNYEIFCGKAPRKEEE